MAEKPLARCPVCDSLSAFTDAIAMIIPGAPGDTRTIPDTKLITAAQLTRMNRQLIQLSDEFHGITPIPVGPSFFMMIAGPSGSGKSTLAVYYAQELDEKLGPVLYVALEEGHGQPIGDRFSRAGLTSVTVHVGLLSSCEDILAAAKEVGAKTIIYDSFSMMKVSFHDLARVAREGDIRVSILVNHCTKKLGPDGKQDIAGKHEVFYYMDSVIYVHAEPRWHYETLKSRQKEFLHGEVKPIPVGWIGGDECNSTS